MASSPKTRSGQRSPVNSFVSDFDQEIMSSFRKALDEPSLRHQSLSILPPPEPDKEDEDEDEDEDENKKPSHATTPSAESTEGREAPNSISIVRARINEFQQKINARKKVAPSHKCPPGGERKVVVYFTSLRGIRKTFEDCWAVRMILKSYGVCIDERDVSMHAAFKEELIDILGPGNRLPRVFADGNYLGGAEELRLLHEVGRLGKLLECCDKVPPGKGIGNPACEGCGDVRFVPCDTCWGSCKVFVEVEVEEEEEEEEEEEDEGWGGFQRCPDCNENGLVRCPLCCC